MKSTPPWTSSDPPLPPPPRRRGDAELKAGIEVAKVIVPVRTFVVLVHAEAGLDRNREGRLGVQLHRGTSTELEVGALVQAAVGLAIAQFEGEHDLRR